MEKNQTFRALILAVIIALIGIAVYFILTQNGYENLIDEDLAKSFINKYQSKARKCLGTDADTADIDSMAKWLANTSYDNKDFFVMHYTFTSNGSNQLDLVFGIYDANTKELKSELRNYSLTGYTAVDSTVLTDLKLAFDTQYVNCTKAKTFAKYAFYTVGDMRNYLVYINHKTDQAKFVEFKFSQIDYNAITTHPITSVANQFRSLYSTSQDSFLLPICFVLDASKNRILEVQAKDMASLCPVQCSID